MVTPDSPARQRADVLAHLPPLLAELGLPLGPVLEGTGIAAADLVPGALLPFAGVLAMLDAASALAGRDDIGLLLGQRQGLDSLGPAGRVMRLAGTLGEALSDFTRFQIGNSSGSAVYLYRSDQDLALGYGIHDPAGQGAVQIHDLVAATGCTLIADLTGGVVGPVEIWSIRPRPADPGPFQRFAGCPVRWGREQTCLFLPPAAADFVLPGADRAGHAAALAQLQARQAAAPWGVAGEVRHALRALMLSGQTGMAAVASRLGLHPRTLRRALAREGTDFAALRDQLRQPVARELLSLTPLPVSDIALSLGFAGSSAFTHAFRRWSGTTPTAWRATHGIAGGR